MLELRATISGGHDCCLLQDFTLRGGDLPLSGTLLSVMRGSFYYLSWSGSRTFLGFVRGLYNNIAWSDRFMSRTSPGS